MPEKVTPPVKSVPSNKYRLVGKNYTTPDLLAKVMGKSKYAEDFRVDGMLFCKLLLSSMPHAKIRSIDARAALAMPGVKGILTADDLPAPADSINDNGATIVANRKAFRGLTMEPLYHGDPILAVAAVDEQTAAEAIEKIKIDFEPLPFIVDPLATLRPGSPNPRPEGNVWVRPPAPPPVPGKPPAVTPPEVQEMKWTEAEFADAKEGRLPMGKATDEWTFGDVDAGFKNSALVLDETFVTPNTSHQCLETRTAMCYWQNGKVYVYTGTQSTAQAVPAIGRWLGIDPNNVVFISEYTGGGFGSKITGDITLVIPALLSKKVGAPVMMRVSREEEQFIGRGRPGFLGRMKVGFSKEGKILALDMFVICDNGAYDQVGDAVSSSRIVSLLYQPAAMHFRGLSVLTNTPPRSAQSSPGGMQGITVMEPLLAKAARKLGIDQVAIRSINAPDEGKPKFGPLVAGKQAYATSCFMKKALDRGAAQFNWEERKARSGKREGTKVRGVGVSMSCYVGGSIGFDGLFVIKPDGRIYIQSGNGNLGTESLSDVQRVVAEVLGVPWERCEITWGSSARNLPWACASGGSQTTHAMTRAAHAAAMDAKAKLQQIAAKDHGGKPEDYEVANERVFHKGGGAGMSLAQAAQRAIQLGGIYDGHELPKDINKMTTASATALSGQGLLAAAKDVYPHDGQTHSFVATFAEVEVDVETGKYHLLDFLAMADVGTIVHPRALGGQVLGRSTLGIGHAIGQKWVYDQRYGLALAKRFHHTKPPTILDIPANMQWAALDIPDPETPVGARGIGEPPVGGGCAAILNALSAAVGDEVFRRAPVNPDTILASLEAGRPMQNGLTSHI